MGAIFLWYYLWKSNSFYLRPLTPIIIACISFTLFFISSPGVGNRAENEFDLTFLISAFKSFLEGMNIYLISPYTVLLFVICGLFYSKHRFNFFKGHEVLFTILAFVLSYLMILPFYFAFPTLGLTPRIFIPVSFLQSFVLFFILFPKVWELLIAKSKKRVQLKLLSITLSVIYIGMISNKILNKNEGVVGVLYSEIRNGKIYEFNEFMHKRYFLLLTAMKEDKKFKIVYLEKLEYFPSTLFSDQDKQDDRRDSKWNWFLEAYFKVDEIRVYENNINKFANIIVEE